MSVLKFMDFDHLASNSPLHFLELATQYFLSSHFLTSTVPEVKRYEIILHKYGDLVSGFCCLNDPMKTNDRA